MDFVICLPWSKGFNAVWVVVDRVAKHRHLVPWRSDGNVRDLTDLFIQ